MVPSAADPAPTPVPVQGFIFDIDGVLIRGGQAIAGAVEALVALRQRGYRLGYLSNDSASSRADALARIAPHGFPATAEGLLTAGLVAAHFAATQLQGRRVLVVGAAALVDEFRAAGVEVVSLDQAERAEAVVMGRDEDFSYQRLARLAPVVARLGSWYATGLDARLPVGSGWLPGTGAMVTAVAYAAGVQPVVLGKPSRLAAQMAAELLGLPPPAVVMVGDSLASDIGMGRAAGMRTVLVLTGSSSRQDAEHSPPEQRPDVVLESVAALR